MKIKVTLQTLGLVLLPIGMLFSRFNKAISGAILGAVITLMLVHIFYKYELKKKFKK